MKTEFFVIVVVFLVLAIVAAVADHDYGTALLFVLGGSISGLLGMMG